MWLIFLDIFCFLARYRPADPGDSICLGGWIRPYLWEGGMGLFSCWHKEVFCCRESDALREACGAMRVARSHLKGSCLPWVYHLYLQIIN
jgi:hypothetical protein